MGVLTSLKAKILRIKELPEKIREFPEWFYLIISLIAILLLSFTLKEIWGLLAGLLFSLLAVALPTWWWLHSTWKKILSTRLSKYIDVLKKREEVNYRNLDSKNIIDAFEKAPGCFYFSYKEVPESVLAEVRDGKIERVSSPASRILEKLREMTAVRFVDVRTGMTSFFVIRSEDELINEVAFDQIVTQVKTEAKMMHSVKSQVIDIPIWRVEKKDEKEEMSRKIGLLFLISGVDIPIKIKEDVRVAREQDRIISDMELMKAMKQAAYDLQEGRRDEYERALSRIAFRAHRRMEHARRREDIKE